SARIPGIGAWASMTSLKSLSSLTLADSATSFLCCARSTCHAERPTKQVTSTSTNSRDPNHLGVSAKRNRSDHRAGLVGRDSDVDALEFLEIEVAGGGQGPTQGADEVEFADRGASGTEEHLLEAADGAQFHSVAARQLRVMGLGAPVHPATGGLGRPGQGGAEHDGVDRKSTRLNSSHVSISY